MIKEKRVNYCLIAICALCLCLWGGIYDFTIAIYGCIFCIGIITVVRKKDRLSIPVNITSAGLIIILICSIISSVAARDHGIAVIGILRIVVFIVFWILWCNIAEQKRDIIWNVLPELLAGITLVSIVLYFIPQLREYLYSAKRLGGVLQYSNTFALLLLASFICLMYREKKSKSAYVVGSILILGIILCGSRTVFVLLIGVILFFIVKKKLSLKYFGIVISGLVILLFILQLLMKLDIQRLLKITLNSSTLNGRVLYWFDGIRVLMKNPLGLGYMGYYFKQPQFQTGNYATKYVHNDFLQMGLDNGIIAMIAFIVIVGYCIVSKRTNDRNRLILIMLSVHAFMDFDLQYGFMFCLLLMTMDTGSDNNLKLKKKCAYIIHGALLMIGLYFVVALGFEYTGNMKAALGLYPLNTFALQDQLNTEASKEKAEQLIKNNGMLPSAYESLIGIEVDDWEYTEAVTQIDEMLNCAGYDSFYYNQAAFYYSKCLDEAVRSEDMETTKRILNKIKGLPQLIEEREFKASKFAYRINDKPKIELTADIQNYIEKMSEIKFTD